MGQRYEKSKKNVSDNKKALERLRADKDTLQNEYAPLSLLDSIQGLLDDEASDAIREVKAVGEYESQRIESETDTAEEEKEQIAGEINQEIAKLNAGLEKLRRASGLEFGKRAVEQSRVEYKKQIDIFKSLLGELGEQGDIRVAEGTSESPQAISDAFSDSKGTEDSYDAINDINFQQIASLADSANRLVQKGGIGIANLSGFHPKVAQDMADALEEAKRDFPALRVPYIGSIQSQAQSIENDLVEFYRKKLASIENTGWSDELIDEAAHLNASRFIKQNQLDDTAGTFAWSLRLGNNDPSGGVLSKYNGVAVNLDYASDYDKFKVAKVQNVIDKFKPIGCDSPRATMDHELGHEIDRMLGASRDPQINQWYQEMLASGNPEELLSGYSATNIAEFIAEAYSEYRNNPKPRETCQRIYRRLKELSQSR